MAKAWKLNYNTGDRVIPLQIVDGQEEFIQRVYVALNTYYKEWFGNTELGVDYYNSLLKKHPEPEKFKQEIIKVLSGFDEILHINDIKIRKIKYDEYECWIEIYSIYGINIFNLEIGSLI
jgi:hypothetical protein